jgi:hypothetical protein
MDRVMMRPGNKSQKFMNDSILNFDSRELQQATSPKKCGASTGTWKI